MNRGDYACGGGSTDEGWERESENPVWKEVRLAAAGCETITSDIVDRWLRDESPSATDAVAWLMTSNVDSIDEDVVEHASRRLAFRLFKVVECATAALSAFDALLYIRALFVICWRRRKSSSKAVNAIATGLEGVLKKWPSDASDLVLLVVLEHLLPMPGVDVVFEKWLEHPVLKRVYAEGLRLSQQGGPQG
ncbi:MAG: hypothetical protein KF774_13280 [Planctomyces sp.]|nr:hypothetical protein [Planctomyces sp.]